MNILDENVLESQRELLLRWHLPFRQVGYEIGRKGAKDEQIVRLLLSLRQPTFFTLDGDFYKQNLRPAGYSLVNLDVEDSEVTGFVRRLLRHPGFDTHAKRMGVVIRASHVGLDAWRLHMEQLVHYDWADQV